MTLHFVMGFSLIDEAIRWLLELELLFGVLDSDGFTTIDAHAHGYAHGYGYGFLTG